MLVLTRKAGEALRIGDDVVLEILELGGGQVRIGVKAPKSVAVHREEIYQRIQRGDPIIPKEPAPLAAVAFAAPPVVENKPKVHIRVKRRLF